VCDVALNRPSYQSSVLRGVYEPHLANDGSTMNQIGSDDHPRCVHSELNTHPWWMVDLGVPLSVKEIFFTNRLLDDAG